MKVVASLVRPVEAETPYGGRVVSYEPVGSLWLSLGRGGDASERKAA